MHARTPWNGASLRTAVHPPLRWRSTTLRLIRTSARGTDAIGDHGQEATNLCDVIRERFEARFKADHLLRPLVDHPAARFLQGIRIGSHIGSSRRLVTVLTKTNPDLSVLALGAPDAVELGDLRRFFQTHRSLRRLELHGRPDANSSPVAAAHSLEHLTLSLSEDDSVWFHGFGRHDWPRLHTLEISALRSPVRDHTLSAFDWLQRLGARMPRLQVLHLSHVLEPTAVEETLRATDAPEQLRELRINGQQFLP